MKQIVCCILIALLFTGLFTACGEKSKYNEAMSLLEDGQIEQAKILFEELDTYQDALYWVDQLTSKIDGVSDGAYYRAAQLFKKYDEAYWLACDAAWEELLSDLYASESERESAPGSEKYDAMGASNFVQQEIAPLNAITEETSGTEYDLEQMVKLYWLMRTDVGLAHATGDGDSSLYFSLLLLLTGQSDAIDDELTFAKAIYTIFADSNCTLDDSAETMIQYMPNSDWLE